MVLRFLLSDIMLSAKPLSLNVHFRGQPNKWLGHRGFTTGNKPNVHETTPFACLCWYICTISRDEEKNRFISEKGTSGGLRRAIYFLLSLRLCFHADIGFFAHHHLFSGYCNLGFLIFSGKFPSRSLTIFLYPGGRAELEKMRFRL